MRSPRLTLALAAAIAVGSFACDRREAPPAERAASERGTTASNGSSTARSAPARESASVESGHAEPGGQVAPPSPDGPAQAEPGRDDASAWARLAAESRGLVPEELGAIELGMEEGAFRRVRTAAQPSLTARDPDKRFYEEKLGNGAEALFGFDQASSRLVQMQIMSLLPRTNVVKPHLDAMKERYGEPSDIVDCPDTGGLPTRRFLWRRSVAGVMDVYLIHPGGISLTFYLASMPVLERSMRMARCAPVPPEQMNHFPMVTAEMIQNARPR